MTEMQVNHQPPTGGQNTFVKETLKKDNDFGPERLGTASWGGGVWHHTLGGSGH